MLRHGLCRDQQQAENIRAHARSTLDPILRLERRGITPQGVALLSAALAYLFARPGALAVR